MWGNFRLSKCSHSVCVQLGDMHGHYTCSSLLQSVAQSSVMLPKHWESNEAESVYGFQKSHTPTTDTTPACGLLTSESRKYASHTQLDFLSLSLFFLFHLFAQENLCSLQQEFSGSLMFRHKIISGINKDLKSSYSYIHNCGFMFCDLFRLICFAACQLLFLLLMHDVFAMFGFEFSTRTLCYCHTNNKPLKNKIK